MVLDPFSALGLAGNIVQFIDFGSKLLSTGKEIYKSGDGAATVNVELDIIHSDLLSITTQLVSPANAGSASTLKSGDPQLRILAGACEALAGEFLSTLNKLKLDPNTTHRQWKSLRQAMKTVWKQSQLEEYQERLDSFRQQLVARLLTMIGSQQSTVTQEIQFLTSENTRMDLNQTRRLDELKHLLEGLRQSTSKQSQLMTTNADLQELYMKIAHLISTKERVAKEQRILSSLRYKFMSARLTKIKQAHEKTFDWILELNSKLDFAEWLRESAGLYWISGKPGSGKSTLMKYLYAHPQTIKLLRKWAGGAELVVASFFFWSIGTHMQKSQEGLLRSLVFEILRQCPALIPKACPKLWTSDMQTWEDDDMWSLEELAGTMQSITESMDGSSKFCFFLDGLDEYDGHHPDIVEVLNALCKSSFIKICASSRAWNVFKDAYGGNKTRCFYLEKLTRNDIEIYVRSELEKYTYLAVASLEEQGFDDLVTDIVSRAQGVFLWVYLVTRALSEGLTNSDDIKLLQARVRLVPSDLQDFFRQIIESVEEVYRPRMAQTFQVVLQVSEPLTLIALSFLEEPPHYALRQPVGAMKGPEIGDRHRRMDRRITGRYKGLLEVTKDPSAPDYFSYRVDFFHRTVHDFVRLSEIQRLLTSYVTTEFDPHTSLCRIYLALIKKMNVRSQHLTTTGTLQDLFNDFMDHARQAEYEKGVSPIDLVDELEQTIEDLAGLNGFPHVLWSRKGTPRNESPQSFREFAVQSCLQLYVQQKYELDPQYVHYNSLLRSVLAPLSGQLSARYVSPQAPDMIRFLLQKGANPNQPTGSSTVFGFYLSRVINRLRDVRPGRLHHFEDRELGRLPAQVLEMLLEHGADPNVAQKKTQDVSISLHPGLPIYMTVWGHLVRLLCKSPATNLSADAMPLLKILLRHGANSYAPYDTFTVWGYFLRQLYGEGTKRPAEEQKVLAEVFKCLIVHGANLDLSIDVPGRRFISIDEIVRSTFSFTTRQVLLEFLFHHEKERKYKRACCSFNMMRGLWRLRVAADPLYQLGRYMKNWEWRTEVLPTASEEANDGPQQFVITKKKTSRKEVTEGQVLRYGVLVGNEAYNVPIPHGSLRFPYYRSGPDLIKHIEIEVSDMLASSVSGQSSHVHKIDESRIERVNARVTDWNQSLAAEQDVFTYSDMLSAIKAQKKARPNAADVPTERVGWVELTLKPNSSGSTEQENIPEGDVDARAAALRRLGLQKPLKVDEALDLIKHALQAAQIIWLWVELPDNAQVESFNTFARSAYRIAGRS